MFISFKGYCVNWSYFILFLEKNEIFLSEIRQGNKDRNSKKNNKKLRKSRNAGKIKIEEINIDRK